MRQLITIIRSLFLAIFLLSMLQGFVPLDGKLEPKAKLQHPFPAKDDLKAQSLEILQTKCNVCHVKQNPRKVFSMENMDALAPKIYKQVFVKKRMPRGRRIKLTQDELNTLESWLNTQNLEK